MGSKVDTANSDRWQRLGKGVCAGRGNRISKGRWACKSLPWTEAQGGEETGKSWTGAKSLKTFNATERIFQTAFSLRGPLAHQSARLIIEKLYKFTRIPQTNVKFLKE